MNSLNLKKYIMRWYLDEKMLPSWIKIWVKHDIRTYALLNKESTA